MEKSYLDLTGRSAEDVQRELKYFYQTVKQLAALPTDSEGYKERYADMQDRMRGFKNYFSRDLDAIIKEVK